MSTEFDEQAGSSHGVASDGGARALMNILTCEENPVANMYAAA